MSKPTSTQGSNDCREGRSIQIARRFGGCFDGLRLKSWCHPLSHKPFRWFADWSVENVVLLSQSQSSPLTILSLRQQLPRNELFGSSRNVIGWQSKSKCLEYLVVHELIHLLEPTHNARFVALMEWYFPQWKDCRRPLNRLSVRYEDWKY